MDVMEYLFLEMASILLDTERIKDQSSIVIIDEMNEGIKEREENMLKWCSLENFLEAKEFYGKRILMHYETDLFRVATKDLLDYTEKLIAMKRERER